jgi:hypothetical protein
MASNVPRSHWSNDSGTPNAPVGNGTQINESELQKIYNNIDTLIASDITFGGLVHSEAYGTHTWQASGASVMRHLLRNTNSGSGAATSFTIGNDAATIVADFAVYSSGASVSGAVQAPNRTILVGNAAGGVAIAATHASGKVRFISNAVDIASAHQIGTEPITFSVSELAQSLGARFDICALSTASAPVTMQSGEPGLSASLAVIGCNYHAVSSAASARINGAIGASWFRMGDVTNVTALEFLACTAANVVTSVFFVDSTANGYSFNPTIDNARKLGDATHRWLEVNCIALNTGDVHMQNGFSFTEHDKIESEPGAMPKGMAIVNQNGDVVAFIDDQGHLHVAHVETDLHTLPWKRTSREERNALVH